MYTLIITEKGLSVHGRIPEQTRFYSLAEIKRYTVDEMKELFVVEIADGQEKYWIAFSSPQYYQMWAAFHGYIQRKLQRITEKETSATTTTSTTVVHKNEHASENNTQKARSNRSREEPKKSSPRSPPVADLIDLDFGWDKPPQAAPLEVEWKPDWTQFEKQQQIGKASTLSPSSVVPRRTTTFPF
jgi:hypothetical protein